jgi:putative tryptophan/tyrosine transport system substrate-binding protein
MSKGANMRRREFITVIGSLLIAWPVTLTAQLPVPTIGILTGTKMADWTTDAFRKGLEEAGYAEGRNLSIVVRSADGQLDRLPALAADLANKHISVIFATGGPVPTRTAKSITTQTPIVFAYGGDPVADGLVASFNRPDGNVTGATFVATALSGKRLGLLREIAPQMTDVALLVNPKGTLAESQIKDTTAAAQTLGLRLHIFNASSDAEVDAAFATMDRLKIDALLVGVDPVFAFALDEKIVALASRYRIRAVYDGRSYVDAGGLISYGPVLPDTWRQAGVYTGRILKGEKPADLPIIQPTKFELVLNLKAAKALGLEITPKLLSTADAVIE